MSDIESIGSVHYHSVASQNIILSQQATTTTQLLPYNVTGAYDADKMTYSTPLSTALPPTSSVAPTVNAVSVVHSAVQSGGEVLTQTAQAVLQTTI